VVDGLRRDDRSICGALSHSGADVNNPFSETSDRQNVSAST